MKSVSFFLAGLSLMAGIYSAYYWWKSSKAQFSSSLGFFKINGQAAVGANDVQDYLNAVGALNARAAIGSGIAVFLATLSTFVGSW
jgi:hypothetical protein